MSTTPEEILLRPDGRDYLVCPVCDMVTMRGYVGDAHESDCAGVVALAAAREEGRTEVRQRVGGWLLDRDRGPGGEPIWSVLEEPLVPKEGT